MKKVHLKVLVGVIFLFLFLSGCSIDCNTLQPVEVVKAEVLDLFQWNLEEHYQIAIIEIIYTNNIHAVLIEFHPNVELIECINKLKNGDKVHINFTKHWHKELFSDYKSNVLHHRIKEITLLPSGEKYTF